MSTCCNKYPQLIFFTVCFAALAVHLNVFGQTGEARPLSEQMAQRTMQFWPNAFAAQNDTIVSSDYRQGLMLSAFEQVWYATGNADYFDYIQSSIDNLLQEDGQIKGYRLDEHNIDQLNIGRALLLLYQVTGKERYLKAATLLRNQLLTQSRTKDGSFGQNSLYPQQVWLDGMYMALPFYANYASLLHQDSCFNDITRQFTQMEAHARDGKTGLY